MKHYKSSLVIFGILVTRCSVYHSLTEEKLAKMAAALKKPAKTEYLFRRTNLNIEGDLDISTLISSNTMKFFRIMGCNDVGFLSEHPSTWETNPSYTKMSKIVKHLTVVNDPAERAIGLIKNFNNKLTKDSVQQNHLLQVVENYNKKHPNANKLTIVKNFSNK